LKMVLSCALGQNNSGVNSKKLFTTVIYEFSS
jgi:hypothetical protein